MRLIRVSPPPRRHRLSRREVYLLLAAGRGTLERLIQRRFVVLVAN